MLERFCLFGAVGVALLAACLFAGRPLWVLAPAAILIGCMLGALAIRRTVARPSRVPDVGDRLILIASLLWTLVLAYGLFQLLPTEDWSGAGRAASALLGETVTTRGTLNAGATSIGVLRLALYGALFLVVYWAVREVDDGWRVLQIIAFVIAGAALYAALALALGWETVLWREKRYYAGWATGPFESRNSFAAFLAMGFAVALALFARAYRRDGARRAEGRERLRAVLLFLVGPGLRFGAPALLILLVAPLTGSRAGMVGLGVAGVVVLGAITWRWRAEDVGGIGIWAGGLAILLVIGVLGATVLQSRERGLSASAEDRLGILIDTQTIAAERPFRGVGLGAFADALHAHKSTDLTNDWRRAHNVYFETVAEIGWPFAIVQFVAVGLIGIAAARGLWTRYRAAPISAAASGALLALTLHSIVDFPLQEPGVCMTLALLLGIAAGFAGRDQPVVRDGISGQEPSQDRADRRHI